jgi:hypothetical protein
MREKVDGWQDSNAVAGARLRLASLSSTLGEHHPEFATALNQLALMLIMQGEPDAAEPVLRQALEVRRDSLGVDHPDYATNLSSLGGLLWARGDLDGAEPLLREAVEVRVKALGEGHPKTAVSRSSLEQLMKARRDAAAGEVSRDLTRVGPAEPLRPTDGPVPRPTPAAQPSLRLFPTPAARHPDTASTEPGPRSPVAGLASDVEALRREFGLYGDQLKAAARAVFSGELPSHEIEADGRAACDRFFRTRDRFLQAADSLSVPIDEGLPESLDSLASLLPRLQHAAEEEARCARIKAGALEVLGQARRLRLKGTDESHVLSSLLESVRTLIGGATAFRRGEGDGEVVRLSDGSHPLCLVVRLVTADPFCDDAEWAGLYEGVLREFGPAVAVAAARGRMAVHEE